MQFKNVIAQLEYRKFMTETSWTLPVSVTIDPISLFFHLLSHNFTTYRNVIKRNLAAASRWTGIFNIGV